MQFHTIGQQPTAAEILGRNPTVMPARTIRTTKIVGQPVYAKLSKRYGRSAATTYLTLRENNQSAQFAFSVMQLQAGTLSPLYPGGPLCVPYRHMQE